MIYIRPHFTPLLSCPTLLFLSLFVFVFISYCLILLTFVKLFALKSFPPKKPPGPLPMDLINMEEGSRLPSQLLKLCSEVGLILDTVFRLLRI